MSTPVSTDRIIECLRQTNGLVHLAAKRVPCSPSTIYQRARDVAKVQRAIEEHRDELVDYGELALRAAVVRGEPWAVGLVLKTLGRNRGYVERQELTGAEGEELRVRFVYEDGGHSAQAAALADTEGDD